MLLSPPPPLPHAGLQTNLDLGKVEHFTQTVNVTQHEQTNGTGG